MADQEQKINISHYLDMLWRRKWYGTLPFFLILAGGLVYCLTAPKVYRSSATISIVRQRVPESFVHSTVTADIDERINVIGQEILSRTRLEQLIIQLNLYPDERKKLPMEAVINKMRESVKINIASAKSGATAFTLSYEGDSPRMVALALNTLTSMFTEEHLKLREEHAKGTSEFLGDELLALEEQLKEKESLVRNYKASHMGELPEEKEANIGALGHLQQQMDAIQQRMRFAEDRKTLIQEQISDELKRIRTGTGADSGAQEIESLAQLRDKLAVLETKYTRNHPDVVKMKNMIRKWMERPDEPQSKHDDKDEEEASGETLITMNLRRQIKPIDLELKNLNAEFSSLRGKNAVYQRRLENTPKYEEELSDLERGYANLKDNYKTLLSQRLQAERAEQMEIRQKGEQFRIIDPARVPEMPAEPNIPKVLGLTLMAALGVAVGFIFAREYLDKSLYRIEDVEGLLKLPVLASIPLFLMTGDLKRQKKEKLFYFSTVGLGMLSVLVLFLAVLSKYPGSLSWM